MRLLKWLCLHSLMAYMLYGWLFLDLSWAENITKFLIWFTFIVYFLGIFADDAKKKAREKGRSVPGFIANFYDFTYLMFLVGWGSVFYGVLYLLSSLFEHYIFTGDDT